MPPRRIRALGRMAGMAVVGTVAVGTVVGMVDWGLGMGDLARIPDLGRVMGMDMGIMGRMDRGG
jgi:hypothetical protein